MQSRSLNNILRILSQLKIYNLHSDSLVFAELAAYDVGFSVLESKIDSLLSKCFVSTLDESSVQSFEELTGLFPHPSGELEGRKTMIRNRLSLTPCHNNHLGLLQVFKACGFSGTYNQDNTGRIHIFILELLDSSLSMEQIYYYLEENMPVHLSWVLEYGKLTFDIFEDQEVSWDLWDDVDFLWNDFDLNGETLFR